MSTILDTIRYLSIVTGALSLFFLGQTWFEFGLSEVFQRFYAWYAGILHPVVELLRPAALWVVGMLGWTLPVWWKDAVVLYLAMGGAAKRGKMWVEEGNTVHGRRSDDTSTSKTKRTDATGHNQDHPSFAWAIVRIVAWPLLWLGELILTVFERKMRVEALLYGYIGTSIVEFAKILIGALAFAALNAGLG